MGMEKQSILTADLRAWELDCPLHSVEEERTRRDWPGVTSTPAVNHSLGGRARSGTVASV